MPVESVSRCRYCTGMFWLRNFSINLNWIAFHHGLLGKCLQNRASGLHGNLYRGNTCYEGSGQPRNQLQTDFMAAHIPHWTVLPLFPLFYFYNLNPNSLPLAYNQQSIIADDLSALTSTQLHSQLGTQSAILVGPSPFWVGPMSLSSLIPPDFPLHIDSIRAELFSRHMSSSSPAASYQGNIMMIYILDIFRQKVISAYGGNIKQVPTIFSITRASSNFDHIRTQFKFGVSAPRGRDDQTQSQMAELVRNYRVRQCWGGQKPPRQSEGWKHGQCAENQSFASVVAQCADLDLKNVIIDTLAMRKSGELVGMCGNCQSYVSLCVLRKHPTWKVVDLYTDYFL